MPETDDHENNPEPVPEIEDPGNGQIDEALEESFPASDPPAYGGDREE
jgi:hypothetical protein